MNQFRVELAFQLLEIESLFMNARAMLGQDKLDQFIIKITEINVKLEELNTAIKMKPETEYKLAVPENE